MGTAGVEILRQIRETFEEKGWKSGFVRCEDSGARPLLVKSNDHCIAFFKRYSYTGECWFELRDRAQVVFAQGERNIPIPQQATKLLANRGGPPGIAAARARPIYNRQVAPVMP